MCSIDPNSPVDNCEILYRSVRLSDGGYRYEDGKYIISSTAFNDRRKQPSVDRAILKSNDAEKSRRSATDCVVSLKASDIRNEKIERGEDQYILDIKPDPEPHNKSHAIIVPSPDYKNDKAFRKVRESLARMAKILLEPLPT